MNAQSFKNKDKNWLFFLNNLSTKWCITKNFVVTVSASALEYVLDTYTCMYVQKCIIFRKDPHKSEESLTFTRPLTTLAISRSARKKWARERALTVGYCYVNSAQNSEASTLLEKPCKPDHYHTYTSRMGVIEMTFATLYSSTEPRAFDILFYPK